MQRRRLGGLEVSAIGLGCMRSIERIVGCSINTVGKLLRATVLIAAAVLPVGCGIKIPHSVSLADRCADIMRAAMPTADIDIEKRMSQAADSDKVIARVEGSRSDLPDGSSPPRALAAECEFDGGILSAFRWTKGGPQRRPSR
jgi:hypothetical protein